MTKKFVFLTIFIIFITNRADLVSQVTGGEKEVFRPDSVIIFNSPTPILTLSEINKEKKSALGFSSIFSSSGFGAGMFWSTELSKNLMFSSDFFITGNRKSDELESIDRVTGEFFVPYKVNRLYSIPFNFNVKYFPFNDQIISTFKPFVSGGAGFAFVISTPYSQSFFKAFGDGVYYTRPSFNVSVGADFGSNKKSLSIFQLRYMNIPFGGKGLESLDEIRTGETPITNFGGIYLDLRIGLNL